MKFKKICISYQSYNNLYNVHSVTEMLLLRGNKGREAAKDSLWPEGVRDSPSSLEGTRLVCSLLAVVRVTSLQNSIVHPTGLYF